MLAPSRLAVLGLLLMALFASLSCGGSGGEGQRILVIDQTILHGIIDEDPEAENFERFPERIRLIADALAQAQPDIVLLQEVVGDPGPDYPNVRGELLTALGSEYTAVFGNFLGEPIDGGGLGQMTFTRLPILSSENRTVSAIRSAVRVTVQTDSGPLNLYNVHLEGTGAVLETGESAELLEIENVIDFIQETRDGGPAILAGDLNAEPDDPSIQRLLQEGFIDALADAGNPTCEQQGDPGCTSGTIPLGDNPDNLADHRIDYIFVLPGEDVSVELSEASLFNNAPVDIGGGRLLWASDHIGVRAVLELRRE
jgi:endonuclease/exonuclease/phosphatase family metal-dependent hydrolase